MMSRLSQSEKESFLKLEESMFTSPDREKSKHDQVRDKLAEILIGGKVGRTANSDQALLAHPIARGIQQLVGCFWILEHLKESEKAHLFVLELYVAVVPDGGDGTYRLAIAARHKERYL